MKIKQENFTKAWNNQRLVAGALKSAHIKPTSSNYEDLFQEGIIIYAQMIEEHPDMTAEEVDRRTFRMIIWRITDMVRKVHLWNERQTSVDGALELGKEQIMDELIIIRAEFNKMSELDQKVLLEHIIDGKKFTTINKETGINRKRLQRSKIRVIDKLKKVLKN
ncbi:MAG: sigma-70 family RNA polymerase sigma factor [Lactobacillus sp.]|nr:sigma-70 family RNA polymerase sigma factor [Lactobacillus sp.]